MALMPWGSYVLRPRVVKRVVKTVPDVSSRFYTTGQVAAALSVSRNTVRAWAKAGLFGDGAIKPGARTLISRDAFEAFCRAHPVRLARSRMV